MLYEILRELDTPGVKSLQSIGDKLGVDSAMLDQLLRGLEAKGCIQRISVCGGGCPACSHTCPFVVGNPSIAIWETTEKGRDLLRRRFLQQEHLGGHEPASNINQAF